MTTVKEETEDHNKGGGSGDEEVKIEQQPFNFYIQSDNLYTIITKRWGLFGLLAGVIYSYHFCWTVAGVNAYADFTRLNLCGGATMGEEASSVFDTAIAISTIFHMIEWGRWTLFLTSALVTVNLLPIFKVVSINVPFGIIASLIAIFTRYSSNGDSCSQEGVQAERGFYLGLQLVCLILYIPMCFGHILFMKLMGPEWCHEQFTLEEEEEDD